MGAFGAQYHFAVWMANYSAESEEDRAYFTFAAWSIRDNAFCAECSRQTPSRADIVTVEASLCSPPGI